MGFSFKDFCLYLKDLSSRWEFLSILEEIMQDHVIPIPCNFFRFFLDK